jgi:membrane-associated protein
MELLQTFVDVILHIDEHLEVFIHQYGMWTYLVLFVIIFAETGLVVTPFLPGDSLLFAAGAISATTDLNPVVLFALLSVAAILGDTVNYWIGAWIGPRAFSGTVRFLKREHLERTHRFFEKYGGKTIIIARFVPIIRTFAPFVAGIGSMSYTHFITYNVVGGILWVGIFVWAGYFFGNLPIVKDNFTIVVFAIIGISLVPAVVEAINQRREHRSAVVSPVEAAAAIEPDTNHP